METYRRQAALLKAIGHPVRLQIVDLLRVEPECVCHLSTALDKSSPTCHSNWPSCAMLANAQRDCEVKSKERPAAEYLES